MKPWKKGAIVGLLCLVLINGCVNGPSQTLENQTKIPREQAITIANGTDEVQEYLKMFPEAKITADIDTKLCLANNLSLEDCNWIIVYYSGTHCCSTQDISHESWRNTALVRISPEGEVLQSKRHGVWNAGTAAEGMVPLEVEETYSKIGECDNMSGYAIEVVDSYVIIKGHCAISFSSASASADYTRPNEITLIERHGERPMMSSYIDENTTAAVISETIGPLPDGEYDIKVIVSTFNAKVASGLEPYWRNVTKIDTTVTIGERASETEETVYCNSYDGELPMPYDIYEKCVCPEGYDKIRGLGEAICVEHHEDSMEPCNKATDCTEPEICVAGSVNGPFKCMRQMFGCYSYYDDNNEIESICVG